MAPLLLGAQILPKENCILNYRIVAFSIPKDDKANIYKVEIAAGSYNSEDQFTGNVIITADEPNNKIIKEMPSFGKAYTWRVVYMHDKSAIKKSAFYHFSIGHSNVVDNGLSRLRILRPVSEVYKDYYVTVNSEGAIYDMQGHAVWYMPDTGGKKVAIADVKVTADSTITLLHGEAYEMNLNGETLWETPKYNIKGKDTIHNRYHHEFIKLSNGHYMTMGMETMMCRSVSLGDSSWIETVDSRAAISGYKRARFSILTEYDKQGHVIWSWSSSKHLIGSDFDYFKPIDSNLKFDPHENAFDFDEDNKVVYLGFRNMDRVIKIEYPSGKILGIYGENFKPGMPQTGKGFFCNPHCMRVSPKGYLYYFNNNSCKMTDSLPTIVMLKEPRPGSGEMEKVWEYTCTVENGYKKRFESGGSVMELPDGSVYVCMGSDYSKLFIVTRDKKILWSALAEEYYPHEKKWKAPKQDRSTIISREDLGKLIWKAEQAKR